MMIKHKINRVVGALTWSLGAIGLVTLSDGKDVVQCAVGLIGIVGLFTILKEEK